MTRPSLQRATAISFTAHIIIFIAALIILSLRPSLREKTYTVNLVMPETPGKLTTPARPPARKTATKKPAHRVPPPKNKGALKQKAPEKKPAMAVRKDRAPEAVHDNSGQAISRLRQKKEMQESEKHRLARLDEMASRKRLEDIRRGAATEGARVAGSNVTAKRRNEILSAYSDTIMKTIKNNWAFPDIGITTLHTEVSITVFADGSLRINQITSPSGNRALDQSVLKAIIKTGSVAPPPFGDNENVTLNFIPVGK